MFSPDAKVYPDPRQHFLAMNRLRNVIHSADFQSLHLALHIVERRKKDDWNIGGLRVRFELGAGLESGLSGHHDVQKNQIRVRGAAEFPSRRAVGRRNSAKAFRVQHILQQQHVDRRVVDDQNCRSG